MKSILSGIKKVFQAGRITGKTAIITGGGSGIGKATAILFAQQGANIVVADISQEKGQRTIDKIKKEGGAAIFTHIDVTSEESVKEATLRSKSFFGNASILVHSAGINMEGNVLSLNNEKWSKTIDTNLTSAFYLTKYVIPQMEEINKGSIVLLSSVQGISGFYNSTAYAASKGGIISMTRQLARDFAANKIRVNCISPGVIQTEIFDTISLASGYKSHSINWLFL